MGRDPAPHPATAMKEALYGRNSGDGSALWALWGDGESVPASAQGETWIGKVSWATPGTALPLRRPSLTTSRIWKSPTPVGTKVTTGAVRDEPLLRLVHVK